MRGLVRARWASHNVVVSAVRSASFGLDGGAEGFSEAGLVGSVGSRGSALHSGLGALVSREAWASNFSRSADSETAHSVGLAGLALGAQSVVAVASRGSSVAEVG